MLVNLLLGIPTLAVLGIGAVALYLFGETNDVEFAILYTVALLLVVAYFRRADRLHGDLLNFVATSEVVAVGVTPVLLLTCSLVHHALLGVVCSVVSVSVLLGGWVAAKLMTSPKVTEYLTTPPKR